MLEDIYAENLVDSPDEDIERVVEGGAEDRREDSEKGSGNEDKKNDDDKDKEKTKIKRKLGPRPVLNPQRLKGPRGIGIMESFFSDIKMKGKGHEREDLDLVLGRLEHWSHRLMPRMQFDDSLKKIEQLGSKKDISNFVKRIRLGMEEDVVEREEVVEDAPASSPPPEDAFDQLMSSSMAPPRPDNVVPDISAEQREQMLRNRLLAEERRAARLKRAEELKAKYRAEHGLSQTVNSQTVEPADVNLSDNLGEHDTGNTSNDVIIETGALMEAENDSTNNEKRNNIKLLNGKLENGMDAKSPSSGSMNNSTLRQTPMEENDVSMTELHNEGRMNVENDHIDSGTSLEKNDAHVTVLNGPSLGTDDTTMINGAGLGNNTDAVLNESKEKDIDANNIFDSSVAGKNLENPTNLEENDATSPLKQNDTTHNSNESNEIV